MSYAPPTGTTAYAATAGYYPYQTQSYVPQAGYQQTPYAYPKSNSPYPPPQTHYYPGAQNYYQTPHQPGGYPAAAQPYSNYYLPQDYAPPSPPGPETDAPLASVSSKTASQAIRHFIIAQLKQSGFEGAQSLAIDALEIQVVKLLEGVFHTAHDYGNLSNRTYPSALDLLQASEEWGVDPSSLKRKMPVKGKARAGKKRKRAPPKINLPPLVPPEPSPPSPELLPSDDDDVPPTIPVTLRSLPYPSYFPPLPPKHTYLRTPPSPPQRATLPSSLERKLANAALVQKSLKNLIESTEDKITIDIPAEKPRLTLTYRGVPKEATPFVNEDLIPEIKEEPLLGMEVDETPLLKPQNGSGSAEQSPTPESMPTTPSLSVPLRPSLSIGTSAAVPLPPIVLGGVVNWESTGKAGRKRWKVGT